MPQDAYTLNYLTKELDALFKNGKVNRITQIDENRVYFTIFTVGTKKLMIDVNPGSPRISVKDTEEIGPLTAPNFCMLLRKHLSGATIKSISIVGFDRIVKIVFLSNPEFSDSVEKVLYVELMGRYSNIILTENGKVLGGNRCINLLGVVRPIIVGKDYVLPPNQDKLCPDDTGVERAIYEYDKSVKLSDYLCKKIQGIATSTAVRLVNSYAEKKGKSVEEIQSQATKNAKELADYIKEFMYEKKYNPNVIIKDKEVLDVCAVDYVEIDGERKFFDYLYKAEEYYFSHRDATKLYKEQKERAKNLVNSALKKAIKRLSQIAQKEKEAQEAETNRLYGELIVSNLYRLKNGEKCIVENYYDENKLIEIPLDKRLDLKGNAQAYFKKYNKQKRTLQALVPQRETAEKEIDYFNSLMQFIDLAEDVGDLKGVYDELKEIGLIIAPPKKAKQVKTAYREYEVEGYRIRVGRSNTENDALIKDCAGEDIWLHAKDYHSSHVIISSNGKTVPESVIVKGAEICAYYSKLRDGKGEIVYTLRKNVKKPKGAKAGFVTYDNYATITVKADKNQKYIKDLK